MEVRIDERNAIAIVHVEGSITQEEAPLLRARIQQLIDDGKCRIVLDMQGAHYMSSIALALVMEMKNKAAQLGGDLKVAGMNILVRNLFEITQLTKRIETYETVEEAVSAFSGGGGGKPAPAASPV